MIVVGVSRFHNASVCLIKDGEILFHIDNERLSNIKYDWYPFLALSKIKDYVDHVDVVAIAGVGPLVPGEYFEDTDIYTTFIRRLGKTFFNNNIKVYNYSMEHHLTHAASSFYSSGFSESLCIVKDGMGSEVYLDSPIFQKGTFGRQIMSVFSSSYPNNFTKLYEEVAVSFDTEPITVGKTTVVNNYGEALAFEDAAKTFGFHGLDAGKVMGMSSYGKENKNIPPIYVDGRINKNLFVYDKSSLKKRKITYTKLKSFQDKADFSYKLQKETQSEVKKQILEWYEKTNIKNICLSGGFFHNCVANYEYLLDLPKEINLYIEPISGDSGTALGAAKLAWHSETKSTNIQKQKSLYYGPNYNYDKKYVEKVATQNTIQKNVSSSYVAKLLSEEKIVAIYQGSSEAGPRALGNRSILFDPRVIDGKDKVNVVKNREWFRPFAGSVLVEKAKEWFDMRSLEESPFMMYAVNVLEDKKLFIPAITHVDGTCRVQTVSKEQNKNFYKLIEEFYKITNVPIIFNTSFNLAGDCIVETIEDAISTLNSSKIDYLYLPELNYLIS
jgi:carbamoyltransferase